MYTTITINGLGGSRFLASLSTQPQTREIPSALVPLIDGSATSIEVELDLADELANFVEDVLVDQVLVDQVLVDREGPPLLFSPQVGDGVAIVRDVLVEFLPPAKRAPRIWRFVSRGARGRVVAVDGDVHRVQLEPSHEIALMRATSMTGARFWSGTPRT
ncbi:MAG TPA: hypothetical protein VK427_19580 [Kofleriaceae bacterium]|nr:hypothetical protein [Kofleriaceae bacterium]